MRHYALPGFWKCYRQLPPKIQEIADKNYSLLKSDPTHPSLHFKRIGSRSRLWSVRVGSGYRALGVEKPDGIYWFWIGGHSEYDQLISN